ARPSGRAPFVSVPPRSALRSRCGLAGAPRWPSAPAISVAPGRHHDGRPRSVDSAMAVPGRRSPLPTLATIIATLGPASEPPETSGRLIEAGVGVFRLNFSHGTLDQHAARVAAIRQAARRLGRPTAIIGDLQGPKIRLGRLPEGGVALRPGEDVLLACGAGGPEKPGAGGGKVPCEYPGPAEEVRAGHRGVVHERGGGAAAVGRGAGQPRPSTAQ